MESGVNPRRYPGCHTAVRRTSIALSTPATPGYTVADALQLESASAPSQIDDLHPDHLGTVRAITDTSQTVIWRWDSTPFGDTLPNEDPDGDGQALRFNLRFPGQYFDVETGLHYNYFRDYDSQTGRYVQSDPIGLAGGINTYGYALQNPLVFTDPTGRAAILPAIPLIIKVCEAAAASMIGIMAGVAIVETVDCDSCEENDDLCNQLAKEARGKAKRVQEHIDNDHFHSKPCVDLNITLTRASAAGCDMSDPRFQTAIATFNRICTDPKNFPPPYGGKPGGPPFRPY